MLDIEMVDIDMVDIDMVDIDMRCGILWILRSWILIY